MPLLRCIREQDRCVLAGRILRIFTNVTWIIDCWRTRIGNDTHALCRMSVAMRGNPACSSTMFALICEYLFLDIIGGLYLYVCSIKAHSYHTLVKPICWHLVTDWHMIPPTFDMHVARIVVACAMLVSVHGSTLQHWHQPKLVCLHKFVLRHNHVLKKHGAIRRCQKYNSCLVRLLETMTSHRVYGVTHAWCIVAC